MSYRGKYWQLLLSLIILSAALQAGCTRTGTGSPVTGRVEPAETEPLPALSGEKAPAEKAVPDSSAAYDLEDELLEDDQVERVTEQVEVLEPAATDTFEVDDIIDESGGAETAASAGEAYDIGYRVQLFATSDLERARELKKIIMAGTGLAVYIEYEGGLYKVRAGDFEGREEAATARNTLVEDYPDCWIVKTTIKKTQARK